MKNQRIKKGQIKKSALSLNQLVNQIQVYEKICDANIRECTVNKV